MYFDSSEILPYTGLLGQNLPVPTLPAPPLPSQPTPATPTPAAPTPAVSITAPPSSVLTTFGQVLAHYDIGIHQIPPSNPRSQSIPFTHHHLQKVGFHNQNNTCSYISLLQVFHRIQLLKHLRRPTASSTNMQEFPIMVLLRILEALPSTRPFTLKIMQDVWNRDRTAYNLTPNDDIYSAANGIISYIKDQNWLTQTNFLSNYRVVYSCPYCGFIEQNHQGAHIPIIDIPNQSLPVQHLAIFDQKLASIVNLFCLCCQSPVHGNYIPEFNEITVIGIDRSPRTYAPGITPQKIETRLSSVTSQTNIGELICVINHIGNFGGGHFVAYTKVNNIWYCHDDSHPMRVSMEHPFNIRRAKETSDLLVYSKK